MRLFRQFWKGNSRKFAPGFGKWHHAHSGKGLACCGKRVGKEEDMYVGVHHHISDPEGFRAAEQKSLEEGLPEGFSLPIHATTPDYTTVICIWEGESVEAVRDLVESVVGEYSENEYFEMAKVEGLPAS